MEPFISSHSNTLPNNKKNNHYKNYKTLLLITIYPYQYKKVYKDTNIRKFKKTTYKSIYLANNSNIVLLGCTQYQPMVFCLT